MPSLRIEVLLVSDDGSSGERLALREERINADGTLARHIDIPIAHPAETHNAMVPTGAAVADDAALFARIRGVAARLRT